MADLASFSLSDRRAAPHSRAHQYRLTAISAAKRLGTREGGREEGREGREGRGGEGRGGEERGGGRGGEGRGQGRGGGGEGRGLSTLSTNQNLCDRGA